MVTGRFTQTDKQLRAALVAVVALIATAAVALSVVLTHEDTVMAKDKPWPTKPAAATSASTATAASSTPTGEQTSPVARNSSVGVAPRPTTKPRSMRSPSMPVRAPITYTVKRGDNLTVIAAWFKMRGYGDLYERNRKVIGDDPNLIRPGQKITIGSRGMSTSD